MILCYTLRSAFASVIEAYLVAQNVPMRDVNRVGDAPGASFS
jgi:hypothetical protein